MARVKLDEEETLEQAEESGTEQFGFNFRQIFDKYVHRQNEKEQMNIKGTMLNKTGQRGNLKRNIHKLEHLRKKATIRKYNHSCRKTKRIIFSKHFFLMAAFCINVYAEPNLHLR